MKVQEPYEGFSLLIILFLGMVDVIEGMILGLLLQTLSKFMIKLGFNKFVVEDPFFFGTIVPLLVFFFWTKVPLLVKTKRLINDLGKCNHEV